jgi:hypothetical protein
MDMGDTLKTEKEKEREMGSESNRGNGEIGVLHRLSISKSADDALAMIVERVNTDFKGGRVTRAQTVSWMLIRQAERMTDAFIREIRGDHFDEISLLESALKQARLSGKLPTELKAVLQKQLIGSEEESAKKRPKKDVDEQGNQ